VGSKDAGFGGVWLGSRGRGFGRVAEHGLAAFGRGSTGYFTVEFSGGLGYISYVDKLALV